MAAPDSLSERVQRASMRLKLLVYRSIMFGGGFFQIPHSAFKVCHLDRQFIGQNPLAMLGAAPVAPNALHAMPLG